MQLNQIVTGDCRDLAASIPDESIDVVFCDPPYLKADIESGVYGWLAETSKRVLKPDGFCISYCGTYWLARAILQMSPHLEYFWEYRIAFRNGISAGIHYGRRTMPASTPLLVFRKGKAMPYHALMDIYRGAGADKSFHKWGQDAYSVQYFLDCFSLPGDVIWDPFCGGGTVPTVCKTLNRDFIAFEIDPAIADIARKRLEIVQPLLMPEEREQYTLPSLFSIPNSTVHDDMMLS
jgi:DNA methylase